MSGEGLIKDNVVVGMSYELTVNGEIIDTSENIEGDVIAFIQGHGQIIPGLEKELYGMKVGDSKKVKVAPAEGYGEVDREAFVWVPSEDFPDSIPLEEGTVFEMREENGESHLARITELAEERVRVDLNHPLAGKELAFNITIKEVRKATGEELDHGHVHEPGAHSH